MGFKNFSLLAAFFFLMNCAGGSATTGNKDTKEEEGYQTPIHVFLEDIMEKEGVEQLSSIASEIVYIPLETNDNSLLKDISHVVCLGNNFVVSDPTNIYLFDHDGKYIKRVAQQGGGPADFPMAILNVITDPKTDNLFLCVTRKILKFDKNAKYTGNIQTNEIGSLSRGVYTDNKTMVFGLLNKVWTLGDTTTVFNAIEIDTLGNEINKYVNNSPRYSEVVKMPLNSLVTPVYIFNNDIKFLDWGNDTIFSVVGGSMIPYAILDLGKNKANYNPDLSKIDPLKLNETLESFSGHAIMNVFEDDIFLFLYLTEKGLSNNEVHCIFNKRTKELKLLKDNTFSNDLDGGIFFFPRKVLKDNELISWVSAEKFIEEILSKDYDAQKAKYGDRFEKTYQLAKSLHDDDNPVLIIAKK